MTELSIFEGFDEGRSDPAQNRASTNYYPKHFRESLGGQDFIRKTGVGSPGIHQLATTGSDANRGSTTTSGLVYFVNGSTMYRLNADFTTTSIGPIDGSQQVSMSDNGLQVLIIVPGIKGYIYTVATEVLVEITDPDFTASGLPQYGVFVASVFAVSTDSKRWIISAINDGLSWNALDFGTAEADPDPIVAPWNFKNEVYIAGTETIQGFSNVGGSDFNYVTNNLILDKGVAAPLSIENTTNTFMWVGGAKDDAPAIWQFANNDAVKVSNSGVDLKLAALNQTELSQITSFSYSEDSSFFIGWNLPNEAVVYGLDTGAWHIRRSEVPDVAGNVQTVGWRAINIVSAYDILICFDRFDGRVGQVCVDFYDEYDTNILREFDSVPFRSYKTMMAPRIELSVESGVGDNTTPDPLVRMRLSKDGVGFTGERQAPMGATGKTLKSVVWRRNGVYRRYFQTRFLFSEKVKFVVLGADVNIGEGAL